VKRTALTCIFGLISIHAMAQTPAPSEPALVIVNATVIDATGAPARRAQTIVVEGDRILEIGSALKIHAPKGARTIDAHGLFVIPGMWDMHVHVWEPDRAFPMFIANGVVGVLDMGGNFDDLKRWREQVESGDLVGPHLVISGPLVDGLNPAYPDHSIVVHDPDEARAAVGYLKQSGADFIKVFDNLTREEYFAIADEAKKQGLSFSGHLPQAVTASEASAAGQLSIEHLLGGLEESSKHYNEIQLLKTTPARSAAAEAARSLSILKLEMQGFDPKLTKALAAIYIKNGTWQVPTLVARKAAAFLNQDMILKDPRLVYIGSDDRKRWAELRDRLNKSNPPDYWAMHLAAYQTEQNIARELHKDGVPMLGGTDFGDSPYVYPGIDLHDELAALVGVGFTPMQALQTVTRNAAKFLGRSDFGTLTQGNSADMVLLAANPLVDIHNTRSIRGVVLRGHYLNRVALNAMLAHAKTAAAGH
jgi:imidazolonepropionase-like amidohydrolase